MAFDLFVTSPSLQLLGKHIERVPRELWTKAMQIFLERTTAKLQASWARALGRKPFPHFTGAAATSIQRSHKVDYSGVAMNYQGRVFSPLEHVGVLEGGRKPGTFPALDAITRWVQLRATRGDISVDVDKLSPKRKRTDAGLVNRTAAERRLVAYRSLAFLIGRSIQDRGQPPRRFARRTLQRNQKLVDREAQTMARELALAILTRGGSPGGGS